MFSNSDLLIALLTTGKSYAFLSEDTLLDSVFSDILL